MDGADLPSRGITAKAFILLGAQSDRRLPAGPLRPEHTEISTANRW